MKSPISRLLQRFYTKCNLFEFILPITGVMIGLGVVSRSSILIETFSGVQIVLYIIFLELGSQLFSFRQREFSGSVSKVEIPREKDALLLLVVLFYGLSVLPLSKILQAPKASPAFLVSLASFTFLIIIWRNIGESAIHKVMKFFIISFNNSFLIPFTQLVFYRMNVNSLFITISQVLFLILFVFLIVREIFNVEIKHEPSEIVQLFGTIPLLKITGAIFLLGSALILLFGINDPKAENLIFSAFFIGLLLFPLIQTYRIDHFGKAGLITLYRTINVILVFQFLGWLILLWLF